MTWFTETPWAPAIVCAIALCVCLVVGLRRGSRRWLVAALLLAIPIPLAFLIDAAVLTPAEEIRGLILELRQAVVDQDVDAVLAAVSPRAVEERTAIKAGMALGHIEPDLSITDLAISVTANSTATSHFRANGTFAIHTSIFHGSRYMPTRWRLHWRQEAGEWKVYAIDRLDVVTGEEISMLSSR